MDAMITNVSAQKINSWLPGQSKTCPEDYAVKLRKSPAFRAGLLVETKPGAPTPILPTPKLPSIEKLSEEKALHAVTKEGDPRILAHWSRQEIPDAVKKAIVSKLKHFGQ